MFARVRRDGTLRPLIGWDMPIARSPTGPICPCLTCSYYSRSHWFLGRRCVLSQSETRARDTMTVNAQRSRQTTYGLTVALYVKGRELLLHDRAGIHMKEPRRAEGDELKAVLNGM